MSSLLERGAAALSSRRSASRSRVLVTLYRNDAAMTPAQLAHACGWDVWRLEQVLYGDGRAFSRELSPMELGQVAREETPVGVMLRLLPAGEEEARRLLREAAWERGRRWMGQAADLR